MDTRGQLTLLRKRTLRNRLPDGPKGSVLDLAPVAAPTVDLAPVAAPIVVVLDSDLFPGWHSRGEGLGLGDQGERRGATLCANLSTS